MPLPNDAGAHSVARAEGAAQSATKAKGLKLAAVGVRDAESVQ